MMKTLLLILVIISPLIADGDCIEEPDFLQTIVDTEADWSANGKHIVYIHRGYKNGGKTGLYLYNLADSSSKLILPGRRIRTPKFSNDSEWIVFRSSSYFQDED
jgi:Tol biopolymer transport system component